jgi:hypothetical protein
VHSPGQLEILGDIGHGLELKRQHRCGRCAGMNTATNHEHVRMANQLEGRLNYSSPYDWHHTQAVRHLSIVVFVRMYMEAGVRTSNNYSSVANLLFNSRGCEGSLRHKPTTGTAQASVIRYT